MITRYVIPLLALLGLVFAVAVVAQGAKPEPQAAPVADPAEPAFTSYVAGAGLIEARSENIRLGTSVSGLVKSVAAHVGDHVRAGDVLFEQDDRELQAELGVRRAQADAARAHLALLSAMPRPEDVPPAEAKVAAAQAMLDDAQRQLEMAQAVQDTRAVSVEVLTGRQYAAQHAAADLAEQQAALLKLRAGAWEPELAQARAELASAEARVVQTESDLDRLKVRAPVDGDVLQSKVRPGEFAMAGPLDPPLMLLGDVSRLHVRVDVDENDAWRVAATARAQAFARGNRRIGTELQFVRFEPFVVPKRSLTGDASERVDTRVLQVLYAFDRGDLPLYVGQQMDVFIEAEPAAAAAAPVAGGAR
ncbi:MAG TPA: biotin/lipoyl-binding protein [Planctomycetota bacterium]|nr:biotin/lipoyl-binding protein [Planctomycetota bacterium]